ncbi:Listeria/Bacterioides repeat-containing protein [Paenibacillus sp. UNCCL117]|uniref:InlB B-repeat-containing protein n=1 Tax=unclassified Paenibacillus TaxID=185978 RepID=UPI0008909442|nr:MULTISPECIES: glycoside hydrolase family 9 protein [unclassified Paenibacillus]SDC27394.1 Listeria/Bacterioides repeat-containing protein [Paenibacillus sp. cl123]SFW20323.1 Listeria/Bacterioides repeat-containing protein [Paenibacillus sp. UNCCL117]
MLTHNARKIFAFLVAVIGFCLIFSVTPVSTAFALKERAPIAPEAKESYAGVINAEWMEFCLVDTPYSDENVTDTDNYTITSTDDPDFSGGVTPILVHYRYFPEQAPYNPSHKENKGKIQVFYRAFLKLPSSVKFKEGKTYSIAIKPAVAQAGPFSFKFDLTKPNLVIHSNQVGYLSEGKKIAYLSLWTGQGSVEFGAYKTFYVRDQTGKRVYTGPVTAPDPFVIERWSKSYIYTLDFSALQAEGTYELYIPGVGVSYPFRISSRIYKDDIAYTITRALFHQRDGEHGLDNPEYTHWNRPPAHLDDAIDQALYLANNKDATKAKVDLTGGHMDAGDRGKYPYNSAYVGIDMLMGAQYYPQQVEALGESLEIPESKNGAPDFLDELVYELDWLYKAITKTSTNGMLANYLRPQGGNPNEGTYEAGQPLTGATNRMFYNATQGPNRAETLFAAGVMAQAYNTPLMQKYYPDKVKDYLEAGKKAFNGFIQYGDNKEHGTYYDQTPNGTIKTWSNEVVLAASALMVATGDVEKYMPYLNNHMPSMDDPTYKSIKLWTWVLDRSWLGAFVSMYENPYLTQEQRNWAYAGIINFAESELKNESPFGASTQDDGFKTDQIGWRFTSSNLMPVLVGYAVTGEAKYLERIQRTWDYTLGGNAVSRSFITGLGDPQREPRWFVHEINQYQWVQHKQAEAQNMKGGWVEPPPGYPNSDLQSTPYPYWFDDAHNTVAKTKSFPIYKDHAIMYRYTDSWNVVNEFSVNILSANATSMLPLIPLNTHILTVNAGGGEVLPAGGSYAEGMELTLTAKAKAGLKFSHWSGSVTGTNSTVTLTMDGAKNVEAHYDEVPVKTLKVSVVNGTVTQENADGNYSQDDIVTLTAEPAYGYKFLEWSGAATGTNPTVDIVMDDNKFITAHFVRLPEYTLSAGVSDTLKGTIKINPIKATYLEGEEVILTAVKKFGYRFSGWTGFDGTDNPAIVQMNGNKKITANFAAVPTYTIAFTSSEGGKVTSVINKPENMQDGKYEEGTIVTLTAAAKPGYLFTGWSGDIVGSANPLKITVDGSKSVTANFKPAYGLMSVDVTPVAGQPGSTTVTGDVYTLTSHGTKFGVAPDSFRYLLRAGQKGDTVFTARLDSFTTDNPTGAVAGIQMRSSLADDAYYAAILVKNGKLIVQMRKGGPWFDVLPKPPFVHIDAELPIWLQIKRTLNRDVELSWSNDGVNWNSYYKDTIWGWDGANTELTMGLFVSAGENNTETIKTAAAQFSEVNWPGMHYLTVNAGQGGSVEGESGLYNADSEIRLRAVPNDGYAFTGWEQDLTGKANPNVVKMDGNKTVKATFSKMPDICELTVENVTGGTIVLDPPGGKYAPNTVVKVRAIPDKGYSFVSWGGDLIGTADSIDLLMDGHKTISAKFVPYKNADILTTHPGSTAEDDSGITVRASGSALWGENDSFRYTYKDNLSGDAVMVAKVTEFNGTASNARAGIMIRQITDLPNDYQGIFITNEKKIRSQFRINNKWTVVEYPANGQVADALDLPVWLKVEKIGTRLTTYSSADGENWVQRGSQTIASIQGSYTAGLAVTAGQDGKFVTAKFGHVEWPAVPTFALQTEAVNGMISVSPSGAVHPAGTEATVTASAYTDYVFTGWSGDLSGLTNPATITMNADKLIKANFRKQTDKYTLTATAEHGVITRSPEQESYSPGSQVILTVTPNERYVFLGWSGDVVSTSNPLTVIMDGNKTLTANFAFVLKPGDYENADVGGAANGATVHEGASMKVTGSGTNVWGMTDKFRYVYQHVKTGDAAIVARVDGMTYSGSAPHSDIKVGLMLRQSEAADSAHQGIFVSGRGELVSIKRDFAGAWSQIIPSDAPLVKVSGPIWLKIEKTGDVVKTYSSIDGAEWIERSAHTLALASPYTMGLVVSAGMDGQFVEGTFSNIMWPVLPAADDQPE